MIEVCLPLDLLLDLEHNETAVVFDIWRVLTCMVNFATSSANCCVWDVEETTFREQDAGRHAINTSANLVSSLMVSYHFTVNYPC